MLRFTDILENSLLESHLTEACFDLEVQIDFKAKSNLEMCEIINTNKEVLFRFLKSFVEDASQDLKLMKNEGVFYDSYKKDLAEAVEQATNLLNNRTNGKAL